VNAVREYLEFSFFLWIASTTLLFSLLFFQSLSNPEGRIVLYTNLMGEGLLEAFLLLGMCLTAVLFSAVHLRNVLKEVGLWI